MTAVRTGFGESNVLLLPPCAYAVQITCPQEEGAARSSDFHRN